MENIINQFGQTIKLAREAANMTQGELAERVGVTERYMTALENEHRLPSSPVLCKLILALNISADSIFYPADENTEDERKQLHRLLDRCDAHDLSVVAATLKAMVESE